MASARPDADRRARQCARLARILRVLQLIQGRARWDAFSLAAELECSPRTVFRDLQVLTVAGVPWYFDGRAQSYRVRADYRFPVPDLTDEEALGQAVAAVLAAAPGLDVAPGSRSAAAKLSAAASERSRQILADAGQLVSVLDLKLADHSRHRETIRTVQWALLRRRQLEGRYRSPYQDRAVTLRLHPYRLCLVQQVWGLSSAAAWPERQATPECSGVVRGVATASGEWNWAHRPGEDSGRSGRAIGASAPPVPASHPLRPAGDRQDAAGAAGAEGGPGAAAAKPAREALREGAVTKFFSGLSIPCN